jgi:ATP-dependent Clp protease protease subunit
MKKDDFDLGSESERILFLTDVDESPIATVTSHLFTLAKKNKKEPIYIVINTFGGSVYDMFALYDAIKYIQSLGTPVNTIGIGKVMSAGVLLLAAGTTRMVGPNASIMYHWGKSEASGDIFDMEVELAEVKRLENLCNNLISQNSKMSIEDVEQMLSRRTDVYMSADEAVHYGLADILLSSVKITKKKSKKTTKKKAKKK